MPVIFNRMKHLFLVIIMICSFFWMDGYAQEIQDTLLLEDTVSVPDSSRIDSNEVQFIYEGNLDNGLAIGNERRSDNPVQVLPLKKDETTLVFYILLSIALLLGAIRLNYNYYLEYIRKSIFNLNLLQQFQREQEGAFNPPLILLFLLSSLVITAAIYLMLDSFQLLPDNNIWVNFGFLFLAVFGFHLIRMLIHFLIGLLFQMQQTVVFYLFSFFIAESAISIVLIPVLLLSAFGGESLARIFSLIAAALISASFIYGWIRGIIIAYGSLKFRNLHFFVYLCTLEIAPVLFLYKIIDRFV